MGAGARIPPQGVPTDSGESYNWHHVTTAVIMKRPSVRVAMLASLLGAAQVAPEALGKPIAFAQGTTIMVEYGGSTMQEVQAFYAPRYDLSFGGGHLRLRSALDGAERDISYLRLNYLAKRWNMESAQANVFVWGGLGSAQLSERTSREFTWNAGAQVDYETRRVYASAKTDLQHADGFSHRIDTVQLGVAPYAHDYDRLATWFVLQGRRYSGGLYDGTEGAVLLRLFKRNAWLDAGITTDGQLQAMLMFNF